ncbi:HDOD domain-containing protein [Pelagicoccus sp. SDUM812003]|uniref:HDOD domain-containing protein n=1 Tax=Pelagicoccus sp. SDUM812003 TaxID=3041267 RepID=UPI002810528E|nr:HDOD domain-containing protein [Pelagicoccus sp. SDUM812003]MDQ8202312.1 HDOD domain-containing protein [Pelagicoccus sp. SDUM812003]
MITRDDEVEKAIRANLAGMGPINLMSTNGKKLVSVLIVESDERFLESVRGCPGLNRSGWVVRTASSAEAGLKALREARVDVFVAGVSLPDLDGISFLKKTKELSPNSLRLLLYKEADKREMGKAVGLMHRRLQQPVAPEELDLAIRQVLVTHLRIRRPEVANIVRETKQLHVNTQPMQELLKTADDPQCDIDTLALIIKKHPTAVATVLQVANTAFYGSAGGVDTLEEALQLMGMDFVRNLAITELAKKQLRLSPGLQELANAVLQHSIEASQYGLRMRKYVKNLKLVQQISSLALLHDLGKLVLLAAKGNDYADLMGQSVDSGTPCWRLERANYGCDHAGVGGFLFSMWGLPEVIVRAVSFHHEPLKVAEKDFCPTSLLHFSNVAAHANHGVSCYSGDNLNEELAEKLGLSPEFAYEFDE